MTRPIIVIFVSILLWFASSAGYCEPQPPVSTDEIQVLIDVSGSMKQNDPQNLRIGASKLLINLLPDGAKVSLWLFAEKTALLSHSDSVNASWKQQALKASDSIHSRGVYTHIEDAIQTVLKDGFTGSGKKHLILLTDGMVDISKDIMVSADSRERILSEWIPRLQQQNINVQTIALSGQADRELLEKLAFDTGGWTETAQSAEQLPRLFVKMAQQAAPKNTLPLNNNRFSIDGSIKEFSLLVFKKTAVAPTRLLTPDQQKIDKQHAPSNVTWLESPGYDLVTVKQPAIGDWQIEAEVDPDNQVMILTDLKLYLNELPNFIDAQEQLPLKAHFTEQDKLLDRKDFLDLVTLTVSVDQQAATNLPASANEPGFFAHNLTELSAGKHHLSIIADGKTFKREIVKDVEVLTTSIKIETSVDLEKRQISVKLLPDTTQLDTASLSVQAIVNQAGKPAQTHAISGEHGEWLLKLDTLAPGSETVVNFQIMGKTLGGQAVSPAVKPLVINDALFTATEVKPAHDAHHEEPEHPETDQHHAETDPVAPPIQETESNWLLLISIVIGVNLLMSASGYFIYKAMKKATAQKQQQLLERLS